MKRSSDFPDYADSVVDRANPTVAAIFLAGLLAGAIALAVFGDASSGLESSVHPSAPAVQYESNPCEPDGTFCEPTYLSPPPAEPAPAGTGLITSQRETPSG